MYTSLYLVVGRTPINLYLVVHVRQSVIGGGSHINLYMVGHTPIHRSVLGCGTCTSLYLVVEGTSVCTWW